MQVARKIRKMPAMRTGWIIAKKKAAAAVCVTLLLLLGLVACGCSGPGQTRTTATVKLWPGGQCSEYIVGVVEAGDYLDVFVLLDCPGSEVRVLRLNLSNGVLALEHGKVPSTTYSAVPDMAHAVKSGTIRGANYLGWVADGKLWAARYTDNGRLSRPGVLKEEDEDWLIEDWWAVDVGGVPTLILLSREFADSSRRDWLCRYRIEPDNTLRTVGKVAIGGPSEDVVGSIECCGGPDGVYVWRLPKGQLKWKGTLLGGIWSEDGLELRPFLQDCVRFAALPGESLAGAIVKHGGNPNLKSVPISPSDFMNVPVEPGDPNVSIVTVDVRSGAITPVITANCNPLSAELKLRRLPDGRLGILRTGMYTAVYTEAPSSRIPADVSVLSLAENHNTMICLLKGRKYLLQLGEGELAVKLLE
jgi:hypothetical protein